MSQMSPHKHQKDKIVKLKSPIKVKFQVLVPNISVLPLMLKKLSHKLDVIVIIIHILLAFMIKQEKP